jgi:hypothetical protein
MEVSGQLHATADFTSAEGAPGISWTGGQAERREGINPCLCWESLSRKSRLTTVRIRCADHATPSIRKSWHYFANRSVGIVRSRTKVTEFSLVCRETDPGSMENMDSILYEQEDFTGAVRVTERLTNCNFAATLGLTLGLLNATFQNSRDYVASNDLSVVNCKGHKRKQSWPIVSFCTRICFKWPR